MSNQDDRIPADAGQIFRIITSFQDHLEKAGRQVASARLYDIDDSGLLAPIREPLESVSGHIKLRVTDIAGSGYEAEFYLEKSAWSVDKNTVMTATEDLSAPATFGHQ